MQIIHAATHWGGLACIGVFVLAYVAVLLEEYTHLRKSKPVVLGAGIIWLIIGIIAPEFGVSHQGVHDAIFNGLQEYGSLLLFLLSAMTYISVLEERNVFTVLQGKLVSAGLSYRQLFWATGFMAFFLSPVADNMTTALVIGAIVMALGKNNTAFVAICCVNIVIAANAGGTFSPFGDITTLMVWQAGKVKFFEFFALALPSFINFVVPAICMHFFVPANKPKALKEGSTLKYGAIPAIVLGISTIAMAVSFEHFFGLPPFFGMMIGLGTLMILAWFIRHCGKRRDESFDIFKNIEAAEWDTLLFFFGVIFCVGGLGYLGYLEAMSLTFYEGWGPTTTNIALGIVSAVIDNIPIMFAVLTMDPDMSHFQWLLITLTAGVGGSLLSIGSAAGVALMGVARGQYTFFSHLKWTPAIILGYAAAIGVHFLINSHLIID